MNTKHIPVCIGNKRQIVRFAALLLVLAVPVAVVSATHLKHSYIRPGLFMAPNNKIGFVNGVGHIVLPMRYVEVQPFSYGVAAVKGEGDQYWKYINRNGKVRAKGNYVKASGFKDRVAYAVVKKEFTKKGSAFVVLQRKQNTIEASQPIVGIPQTNSEGMVTFRKNELFGVVDYEGLEVVKPSYTYIGRFREGLAVVARVRNGKMKAGYINTAGHVVIPLRFRSALAFGDGLAPVQKDNGKWAYSDRHGRFVIDADYKAAYPFHEGLGRVKTERDHKDFFGFVDEEGDIRIPFMYSFARDFHEGLATVAVGRGKDMKRGYVDYAGRWVLPPTFSVTGNFHRGLAYAGRSVQGHFQYGIIDRSGQWVWKQDRDE